MVPGCVLIPTASENILKFLDAISMVCCQQIRKCGFDNQASLLARAITAMRDKDFEMSLEWWSRFMPLFLGSAIQLVFSKAAETNEEKDIEEEDMDEEALKLKAQASAWQKHSEVIQRLLHLLVRNAFLQHASLVRFLSSFLSVRCNANVWQGRTYIPTEGG